MTRLWTDGAEGGGLGRWSAYSGSNLAAVTTLPRTGTYSYLMKTAASDSPYYTIIFAAGKTEFYARFAIYFLADDNNPFLYWMNGGSAGGSLRTVTFGTVGTVSMYDGGTLRATSSPINLNINEWHVFEVHVKIAASPNGVFQLKFDGTLVIDWAGATNAQASMDRLKFVNILFGVNLNSYRLDDIAVNDIVGANDNAWPGDGGVLAALVPTGVGNYTDLIASAGDAWACVDEIPSNSDTDYAYESTIDKKSTYVMSNLAGLPTNASIPRVWVELAAKQTAAEGDKIATFLRSATTNAQGADQALTIAYARYLSAEYLTDPADAAAWTQAKVDALQAGAIVR